MENLNPKEKEQNNNLLSKTNSILSASKEISINNSSCLDDTQIDEQGFYEYKSKMVENKNHSFISNKTNQTSHSKLLVQKPKDFSNSSHSTNPMNNNTINKYILINKNILNI